MFKFYHLINLKFILDVIVHISIIYYVGIYFNPASALPLTYIWDFVKVQPEF